MTRRHRCAWRAPTRAAYGALASIIFRRIGNPTWSLAGCVAVAACTGALVASGCELRFGIRHLASGVELDGLFVAEPTNDARAAFWSWPAYGVWRRQPEFRDVAAEGTPTPAVPLPAHHTTATIRPVSAGYFSALGVRVKGREFVAADDAFGAEPVAVVSEGLLRRLGDNRPSIGSVLQCGPVPLTIVGISQGGFRGTELQSRDDIWIPMRGSIPFKGLPADWLFPDSESTGTPVRWIRVLVRIPPDTTPVAPPSLARADGVRFQPLHVAAYPVAGRRSVALLLRGWTIATLLLVLVACAAVAGVFLAAVYGRRQAVVMRYVVGASAFRVLMAECWRPAAAASLAGGAAMLVTSWLLALWDRLVLPGAVAVSHLSSRGNAATLWTAGLSAAGVMAAASGPALVYAWRLRSDSYPCEPRRKGLRRHRVILAIQSFLAVVLAMGALAPHAVVGRAMHEPLGFDPRQVAFFRIGGRVSVRDDVGKAALVQALLAQLRDTPAVEAGTISRTLLGPDVGMTASLVRVRGEKRMVRPHYLERYVGPSIASVLGLSVMAGRDLDTSDVAGRPSVALVTASFASQAWGTGPAVGQRFSLPGHPGDIHVAGVVADTVRAATRGAATPTVFLPVMQHLDAVQTLDCVVRVRGDAKSAVSAIQGSVNRLLPGETIQAFRTVRDIVEQEYALQRLLAATLLWFAVVAMAVASVGVCAAVSQVWLHRRHELGVRIHLGATPRQIMWLVVADTLRPCTLGCIGGFATCVAAQSLLEAYLDGMGASYGALAASAACAVMTVAAAAGYVAAVRMAQRYPVSLLRDS